MTVDGWGGGWNFGRRGGPDIRGQPRSRLDKWLLGYSGQKCVYIREQVVPRVLRVEGVKPLS